MFKNNSKDQICGYDGAKSARVCRRSKSALLKGQICLRQSVHYGNRRTALIDLGRRLHSYVKTYNATSIT